MFTMIMNLNQNDNRLAIHCDNSHYVLMYNYNLWNKKAEKTFPVLFALLHNDNWQWIDNRTFNQKMKL